MTYGSLVEVQVNSMRLEAKDVVSIELGDAGGNELPMFTAGAHIDLHLANGMVRSYSLLNAACERRRYVVGVLNDKKGRGGSRFIHDRLRVGEILKCSAPRNNFVLNEDASETVLIAGGIGVTPIICMFDRLLKIGRSVELIYCAKSRREAAFLDKLTALGGNVHLHFDDERGGPPDLKSLLAHRPGDPHFYCCGPEAMLAAFERTCGDLAYHNVHLERFAPAGAAAPVQDIGYQVKLAKSGITVNVPAGKALIDALEESGIEVTFSCREGVCGVCETRVLDGTPDHRDSVLTERERDSGQKMMVCVSGCKGNSLTLDI
jgi:tetrachlorobenzoquinone reductase